MNICRVHCHQTARAPIAGVMCGGRALALSLGLAFLPLPANSGEKTAAKPDDAGSIIVQAHYRLRYNGIEVGRMDITSNTTAKTYTLSGSSKISVLFGAFSWSSSSSASGTIERGAPVPSNFAFDWRQNKKAGYIRIGFKDRAAADIAVKPPAKIKSDIVPLRPSDKQALDPMSAVLMLTKADSRPPCDRRVGIFDGKQRYDIVLTPKRLTRLPSPAGGAAETAYVCRVMYEPVAGHRDNEDTRSYAANRDVELVMRRVPGSDMLIPYSASVPTAWGTGTMVTDRIEVSTAAAGRIAYTN